MDLKGYERESEYKTSKTKLFDTEHDNGNLTCKNCVWNEEGDSSIGLNAGCTHPILYDEEENLISEMESLILECLSEPNHCTLLEKKPSKR